MIIRLNYPIILLRINGQENSNVLNVEVEAFNGIIFKMKIQKCVICGEKFEGYGNNPRPLKDHGVCCDFCNADVLWARIQQLKDRSKNETA